MDRRLFLFAAACALAGCASAPPARVAAPPGAAFEELEPVFAVSSAYEAITIRVSSNGCTKKADFAFYVEHRGEAAAVAFARKTPDNCRAFARSYAELTYSFDELGVSPQAPLFLLNPFERWYGPGSVGEARR